MRRAPDPRVGRLRKRPEFLAAAGGRRHSTDLMTMQARPRADEDGPRFGLTITKRVGHATERNRIRRRLRAAVQEAAALGRPGPFDIVVVGRRPCLSAPFDKLVADLGRALASLDRPPRKRSADRPARLLPDPGPC